MSGNRALMIFKPEGLGYSTGCSDRGRDEGARKTAEEEMIKRGAEEKGGLLPGPPSLGSSPKLSREASNEQTREKTIQQEQHLKARPKRRSFSRDSASVNVNLSVTEKVT